MRWIAVVALSLVLTGTSRAAGPDERYLDIYNEIIQADHLQQNGRAAEASTEYLKAQTALKLLKDSNPTWNTEVVNFRLDYLAGQLQALAKASAPAAPPQAAPAAQTAEVANLQEQIRSLSAANAQLENKLKEALSVQPAAVSPGELAKADEKIVALQKQNDLLNVALHQAKASPPPVAAQGPSDADARSKAAQAEIARLKNSLADAQKKIAEDAGKMDALKSSRAPKGSLKDVAAERDKLKEELTDSNHAVSGLEARSKADAMVAQAEMARLKNALSDAQQKLVDDADKIAAMKSARAPQGSIEAIAAERDQLKEELARRSRDLADAEAHRDQSAPAAALAAPAGSDAQVEQLRARLAVLEAQSVPYTPEELAVMKSNPSPPLVQANEPVPAPAPASPAAPAPERPHVVHSMKDLPPGAGALMTEAQRAMMQRDFAGAAEKYGDILHQDENNVYVLDHLAAAQCAMSHMTDLEKTVARALALDPDDPTSLRFLGILRYHEEKLDEALNALSLSAKYNPTNADTQYYLGSVLADKGLRPASETAFRKALEADPQFADAHFRLAVVYADEKPPSIELARWHYRRALDLGHPKNPALEKTLMPSP